MQRVASMSVIVKAEGVPEAFYNKQRDRVVEAIRSQMGAELEREREWAAFQQRKSAKLQKERAAAFMAEINRKPGLIRRARNAVATAWVWAWVTAGRAWKACADGAATAWDIFWGLLFAWKLVEYVGDEEESPTSTPSRPVRSAARLW